MSLRYIKKQDDASAISKFIEIDPVLLEQYIECLYMKRKVSRILWYQWSISSRTASFRRSWTVPRCQGKPYLLVDLLYCLRLYSISHLIIHSYPKSTYQI